MARTSNGRKGAILLIVLVLLALFAVVGLAFVLFAQAEAVNSRIQRDTMNNTGDVPDPQAAVNDLMRQLIYGSTDNGLAITSALRGHDLARTAYGYNLFVNNTAPYSQAVYNFPINTAAYSGIGNFSENVPNIGDRRSIISFFGLNSNDPIADPEYTHPAARTALQVLNAPLPIVAPANAVFVGKNAPYTYPDRNNAFLAMQDPATGQIVIPSFHRPSLFGTLDSSNPNWTDPSPAARAKILRPRPADHVFNSQDGRGAVSDLPYPQRNPDGTYTGDVQNMRYANGVQQNDAVWMHANLPVVKYRGRDLQPLIAMTILPLDGRVNCNVSGNHRDNNNGHASNQGFGPYEIDPQRVLVAPSTTAPSTPANEGQSLIAYRYGNTYRPMNAPFATGVPNIVFDPEISGSAFADYSPVNFDAFNAPYPVPCITAGLRTEPYYGQIAGYDNNLTSARHQSLFNPYFLTDTSTSANGGRTLRLFDLRQTAYRYSGRKSQYAPPLYGFTQPDNSFTGASPNHPSNKTRAMTTTISNSLNRAFVMPNFSPVPGASSPATAMNYPAPPITPASAPTIATNLQQFTTSVPTAGLPTDTVFGTGATGAFNGFSSSASALGPIDLNRPLADYRTIKNVPLRQTNNVTIGQAANAARDRQQFAKDIFDRLVVATGAPCDGYHPVTKRPTGFATSAPAGSAQFNALRYLAQIAANIVDFIDVDDVNTGFVWNPANAANPAPESDPANFQPGAMSNSVVFGVEKTRCVINEAYAEVTNDQADTAEQSARRDFQVRFFVELLNPLNAVQNHVGPNATNTSPFGDGSALLNLTVGATASSVYRVQVFEDGNALRSQLFDPATAASNVTGMSGSARLSAKMPANTLAIEPFNQSPTVPNIGPVPPDSGFRHLLSRAAMDHDANADNKVYKPNDGPKVIKIAPSGGQDQLHYTVPSLMPDQIVNYVNTTLNTNATTGKHAVLLQRLANPYIAEGPTNPYITVDSMFDVLVNDAVRVGRQIPPPPGMREPIPGTRPNGVPDRNANEQRSHGRRAPLYAYRGTSALASYAADQRRSFLSHNTTGTPSRLLGNFEWLAHHDRKLITPLELLQVAGCKPHELLHYFVTSPTAQTDVTLQPTHRQHHVVPWQDPQKPMARALEMLTVKPWMYGVPAGGRQPGRINVNAIWNKDVLTALLDPRTGNAFTQLADIDPLWSTLFTGSNATAPFSRTKAFPTPGTTVDEGAANGDRPFKSFGVANFAPGATSALPSGAGVNDTLFRTDTTGKVAIYRNATVAPHPMQQSEMLRKAYNNITTTTDTYVCIFTIGYFEIRATGATAENPTRLPGVPTLGREVFTEIPGDLRVQYAAIIDRSMLAVTPDPTSAFVGQQAPNVFFTELASTVDPTAAGQTVVRFRATGGTTNNNIQVDYEGRPILIKRTPATGSSLAANEVSTLVLGTGSEAIYVRIPANAAITAPGTSGIGTITFPVGTFAANAFVPFTVTPATLRKYYAGEAVGSAILGNPGPQAGFDPNAPTFRQVVRDLIKLSP